MVTDAVAAVHDLIRRATMAETHLEILRAEWAQLTHEERVRLGEIAPSLVDVIIRIS